MDPAVLKGFTGGEFYTFIAVSSVFTVLHFTGVSIICSDLHQTLHKAENNKI